MNILVLSGGISPEREVSLSSGSRIANSLIENGHKVAFADVYIGVKNIPENIGDLFLSSPDYSYSISEKEPDLDALIRSNGGRKAYIGEGIIELCEYADVVFLGLHGGAGENGTIQAALDAMGIAHYTGSGYSGCLLAMDKNLSKHLMRSAGVNTADWITVDASKPEAADTIIKGIGVPCVIKPCGCGSSCGVSIVNSDEELIAALEYAKKYENSVLAEKKIIGREFSVGILDGKALPPIEILPLQGWYDYKNKYQSGLTKEVTPADLTPEQTDAVSREALAVHKALGLGSYSRIDFLLDEKTGKFVCLEANALPGMTPTSLLPQEAAAVGIDYHQLCEKIVISALEKRSEK
ncbi:MAG: D-alanine--D-alanine ligase [Clostridia bacterium]|nr:D-alanine--D-alanine ligase [Clostridia bacterium]